jgi:hypothetical protein
MTSSELAEKALRKLNPVGDAARLVLRTTLLTLIPVALELLADKVAQGPGYKGLQKDFDLTPVAGAVDIPTLMIFDINRSVVRVASSNDFLTPIDDILTLENGNLPSDQVYYALDGSSLRFRSTTPSLTDYATAVKVRANFIPTPATLPTQYEGNAVEVLVSLVGSDNADQMSATGRA